MLTRLYLGELPSVLLSADLHTADSTVRRARGMSPDIISSEGTCKEVSLGGKCLVKAVTETSYEVSPLRAHTHSQVPAPPRDSLSGQALCSLLQFCVRLSMADSPDSAL